MGGRLVVVVVVVDVDVVEQVVGEIIISPLGPSFDKKVSSMSDICQVSMYTTFIQGHLAVLMSGCCFEMFPGSWQYDFSRNVVNSVSPQMPHCHCPPWSFSTFILLFCLLTVKPNQRHQELRWQFLAFSPFCITASSLDLAKVS